MRVGLVFVAGLIMWFSPCVYYSIIKPEVKNNLARRSTHALRAAARSPPRKSHGHEERNEERECGRFLAPEFNEHPGQNGRANKHPESVKHHTTSACVRIRYST